MTHFISIYIGVGTSFNLHKRKSKMREADDSRLFSCQIPVTSVFVFPEISFYGFDIFVSRYLQRWHCFPCAISLSIFLFQQFPLERHFFIVAESHIQVHLFPATAFRMLVNIRSRHLTNIKARMFGTVETHPRPFFLV